MRIKKSRNIFVSCLALIGLGLLLFSLIIFISSLINPEVLNIVLTWFWIDPASIPLMGQVGFLVFLELVGAIIIVIELPKFIRLISNWKSKKMSN